MNSKILAFAGILLVSVVVFVVALTHSQSAATSPATAVTPDSAMPDATTTAMMAGGSTATSTHTDSTPTRPVPKVVPAPTPTVEARAVAITIKNYMFSPQTITVKKGTTVTWTNKDIAKHTITSDDGSWPASQFFGQGESYSYTFTSAGTYAYHCEPHPYMTATVVVTE